MKPHLRPQAFRTQSGTAALEALVSAATLATLIGGGMAAIYFAYAHVWLDRYAYETLVCLSTTTSVGDCESRLRAGASAGLPIGELGDVHLSRSPRNASVSFHYRVGEKIVVRQRQTLRLPIAGRVLGGKPSL